MTLLAPPEVRTGPAVDPAPRPVRRITPNLFAISFGLAGLAQTWTVAARSTPAPLAVAEGLWLVAGAVWLGTLGLYLRSIVIGRRRRTELADHTFGPFVSVPAIVATLLASGLEPHARAAAVGLFVTALVVSVALAGRLLAVWLLDDSPATRWHPGYLLPSVGAPLVAAATAGSFGFLGLARLLFGAGVVSWFVIGTIVLHHLVGQPGLPTPLVPTLAILVAPPIVAGNAWFAINGHRPDGIAIGLAGYAVLMAVVQLGLIPAFRAVPFGSGWWSLSFPYAAATGNAVLWLGAVHVQYKTAWTYLLLTGITAFIGILAVRTIVALARGRFL